MKRAGEASALPKRFNGGKSMIDLPLPGASRAARPAWNSSGYSTNWQ